MHAVIRLLLGVLAVAALAAGPAAAQKGPPVLRIETGGHAAMAWDAATDAAARVLVTASDDKTARIWSLPDLRPLGVLRPAVGDGREGQLWAVAVSPDGRLAAVGGWTVPSGDQSVLLFDLATRQVVRRLGGLPESVYALAFSPDGRRLAAGLGGTHGIRVWDTATGRQSLADADYRGGVFGLSFAPDLRLAAESNDGGVRLYAPDGRRLVRVEVSAGQRPYRLAFSPDGSALAIGSDNTVVVEVRDGTTLALRGREDGAGLAGGYLSTVAWSADGRTLLAAGGTVINHRRPVFAWSDGGRGTRRIADAGFTEMTTALRGLPDGSLAMVSARGALAVLDPSGRHSAERTPAGQNLNTGVDRDHITRHLLLSADGTQAAWVAFGTGQRWRRFDVARLGFTATAEAPAGLADWTDAAGTLRVTDWDSGTAPKLNGAVLAVESRDIVRSVAAAPGQVLLGTSWWLRLLDPQGKQRWQLPVPGEAWRVNQSTDGRLAVAAYNDGTLRWHRLDNGREVLALFATADAERWVAWTPTGYYAASPGGEELIGWHLNRGLDQAADWFPASRFRDRFYRPDVVQRVLATLDEAEAVRQADAARGTPTRPTVPLTDDLPPVISITAPADNTLVNGTEAQIDYTLRSPSGRSVRAVRVLIDGKRIDTARGLERLPEPAAAGAEAGGRLTITLPADRDHFDLALLAETETRAGESIHIQLRRAAPVAAGPRPALYALLVGVSDYHDPALRLGYAAKDAGDLAAPLRAQAGRMYREVEVRVLADAAASREAVLDGLDWLARSTTAGDVAVLFLAGHGANDAARRYYFLPADADRTRLRSTAVAGSEIQDAIRRTPGRVLALLDTCHSGNVLGTGFRSAPDVNLLANELSATETGAIVFASSTGQELSREDAGLANGVFAAALKEGLSGKADLGHRGAVYLEDLNYYVLQRVKTLTGGEQHPVLLRQTAVRDFPLAVVP